jgi:hypothetical protein
MDRKLDRNRATAGGRPATGSIVWADDAKTVPVGVRVTNATGKRTVVRFDPGTTRDDAIGRANPNHRHRPRSPNVMRPAPRARVSRPALVRPAPKPVHLQVLEGVAQGSL